MKDDNYSQPRCKAIFRTLSECQSAWNSRLRDYVFDKLSKSNRLTVAILGAPPSRRQVDEEKVSPRNTPARRQRSQVGAAGPISGCFPANLSAGIRRGFVCQRHNPARLPQTLFEKPVLRAPNAPNAAMRRAGLVTSVRLIR